MSQSAHGNYYPVPPPFFPAIINLDFSPNVSNFMVLITFCLPFFVFCIDTFFTEVCATNKPAGCKKLGLDISHPGHMRDQYSSKYDTGGAKVLGGEAKYHVKALFCYPIKGCAPVEMQQSDVVMTGLKYDRVFSFAQRSLEEVEAGQGPVPRWRFVNQEDYPQLAQINCEIWIPDRHSPLSEASGVRQGWLIVKFPAPARMDASNIAYGIWSRLTVWLSNVTGSDLIPVPMREFRVPLDPNADWIREQGLPTRPFDTYKEAPDTVELGAMIPNDVQEDLNTFVGVDQPMTLFRHIENIDREDFRKNPRRENEDYEPVLGFTNSAPIMFNNLASIHRINTLLDPTVGQLDARRFHAQIYITGPEPYEEDIFQQIRIGAHYFNVTGRTATCTLPSIDPAIPTRKPSSLRANEITKHNNNPANKPKTFTQSSSGGKASRESNGAARAPHRLELHTYKDPHSTKKPCLGMEMAPEYGVVEQRLGSWRIAVGDVLEVVRPARSGKLALGVPH